MPNIKQLRKSFNENLKEIWEEWDNALEAQNIPADGISPFLDLDEVPSLDESAGFNWQVGWLSGISVAMDWPLDRPLGPKQWSPKGRHPQ